MVDCVVAKVLWCKILNWLGVCYRLPNVVSDHALYFCNVYSFSKEIYFGVHAV
jgi:hypothetical protein